MWVPSSSSCSSSVGKQSQLLLKPTEGELGLQVGVEFDKNPRWDWEEATRGQGLKHPVVCSVVLHLMVQDDLKHSLLCSYDFLDRLIG